MVRGGKRRNHVTEAIKNPRHAGHFARSDAILPEAADDGADSEKKYGQSEIQLDGSFRPMFGAHERLFENAPAIHGAQANLHADGGERDAPSVRYAVGCHGQLLGDELSFSEVRWCTATAGPGNAMNSSTPGAPATLRPWQPHGLPPGRESLRQSCCSRARRWDQGIRRRPVRSPPANDLAASRVLRDRS